jgi:hypothetical protein
MLVLFRRYSTVYVGTNTYLTFSAGSTVYTGLGRGSPALPSIHLAGADNSGQRIGYATDGSTYTFIRYEGKARLSVMQEDDICMPHQVKSINRSA